jgi:hypothetical protein
LFYCLLATFSSLAIAQPPPEVTTFSGTVYQSDGSTPAVGATVLLRRSGVMMMGSMGFWGATVATDERGRFEIPKVEEGQYQLTIILADFPPLVRSLEMRVNEMENLTFKLAPFSKISGTLIGTDGRPAALHNSVILTLNRTDVNVADVATRFVATDGQGRFQLERVASGCYVLMAYNVGMGFGTSERLVIKEGEDTSGVIIRLRRGAPDFPIASDLPARITPPNANHPPLPDGLAQPTPPAPAPAAPSPLIATPPEAASPKPPLSIQETPNGFAIVVGTGQQIPPEPPKVPSANMTVHLRRSGDAGETMRVVIGEPSQEGLDIWSPRASNVLIGRVLQSDGVSPLRHAQISATLEPQFQFSRSPLCGSRPSLWQHALMTDADGAFRLTSLLPGRYLIHIKAAGKGESVRVVTLTSDVKSKKIEFRLSSPLALSALDTIPRDN